MEKKKSNQKNKNYLVAIFIIVILIIAMFSLKFISNNQQKFKIEPRTKAIEKEKEKDKDNFKTIGWLRVQGTNIDTPIVGFIDNGEKYRNYEVDKERYLWNHNEKEKQFNKVAIIGHNIMNLSGTPEMGLKEFTRFEDLMSFIYYDFVKENQFFQYSVDGKDHIYKVFGVYFDNKYYIDIYNNENYEKDKLDDFIKNAKEKSFYNYDVDVNGNDNIASLVTCTRFFGNIENFNFTVVGRELRENEKVELSEVTKNKSYNKIEEILKKNKEFEK